MQNIDAYELVWALTTPSTTFPLATTGTTFTVPVPVNRFLQFSVGAKWQTTTAATGTLIMEVIEAYSPNPTGTVLSPELKLGTGWVAVPGLVLTIGTDASPGILHNFTSAHSYMRLNYTYISGSDGTLNTFIQGVTV